MLDGDAVVPRRSRPTERTLILAGAARRLARSEVVGALPAVLGAEDGTELRQTLVQRA